VETALNAELDDHLGYDRHEQSDESNSRNGFSTKVLQTEGGQFDLGTPRDRTGSFESKLVKNTSAGSPQWMTKSFFCMRRE